MLRRRFRGDSGDVAREAQCRARLGYVVRGQIRDHETFSSARQRPLQQTSEHGVPIRHVYGVVRSATAPRERPKDVAQTKEASVDGARFPEARVAGARLGRARPICPFRSREVDERERAREPILAVVAVKIYSYEGVAPRRPVVQGCRRSPSGI